jgi:hypothetical protein
MSGRPPAQPGDPIAAIDTPALVVDLAVFDANIGAMAQAVAARGLRLRPHAKAHKCPDIAVRQIAAGAIGICCQKTDEAAVFAAAGVRDILVTNEVVLPAKLARLAALARDARIGVLCDNAGNVAALQHAAAAASSRSMSTSRSTSAHAAAASRRARRRRHLPRRSPRNRHCALQDSTATTVAHSTCVGPTSAGRRSHRLRRMRVNPGPRANARE